MIGILVCTNIVKMENIYKYLYKDEEDRYMFATEEDTRYVVDQQSYILIYILEQLLELNKKEENKEFTLPKEEEENAN